MEHLIRFFFLLLQANLLLNAQHNSILWKIHHPESKTSSYLFGTMHTGDKSAYTFAEKAKALINQCDAFAMELLLDDNQPDLQLMMGLMMTDGTTLQSLFSESDYRKLDSLITAATGFSLALLNNMQPIVLMALLEQLSFSNENELPLDLHLLKHAQSVKKKTFGIETPAEQLKALQALNYKEQAEMISLELNKINELADESDKLGYFYSNGMLDSLLAINRQNPMPQKLENAILHNRNEVMAKRIAGLIKKQSVFVAVGALHLPGSTGVLELLRAKGIRVEPLYD